MYPDDTIQLWKETEEDADLSIYARSKLLEDRPLLKIVIKISESREPIADKDNQSQEDIP